MIQGYTRIMVEIYGAWPAEPKLDLLEVLATARAKYVADRSLLDVALTDLKAKSAVISPEVISAVRSLELKGWIYLKDTTVHSIFIDPSVSAAYGVLGLTERIRDVVGGTGAVVETGLLQYLGRYVSDGIFGNVLWLGRNYKREFATEFARLRADGKFRKSYAP